MKRRTIFQSILSLFFGSKVKAEVSLPPIMRTLSDKIGSWEPIVIVWAKAGSPMFHFREYGEAIRLSDVVSMTHGVKIVEHFSRYSDILTRMDVFVVRDREYNWSE